MYLLILNLCILLISITESQKSLSMCYFGTSNKYLGRYNFDTGKPPISYFISFKTNDKNICNKKCQFNELCYATSFDNYNNCSFYNTSDFVVNPQYNMETSRWIRCGKSNGYQPPDNRCFGSWITYSDKFVDIEQYQSLNNIFTDILKCRNACLQNPLCGFVNRFDGQCILVAKWPYQSINVTNRTNWEMDEWVCVDNFINNFQIKKQIEKPIDEKCTGYWEITNRNTTLTLYQSRGLSFQTQIYENCLVECNQYPNCTTAWYNFTYSLCILKDVEISEVRLLFNDTIFINFEWKCIKNDSRKSPLNSDERKYLNLGMNCYKIVNDTNLFIGRDKCGQCPHESEFHHCSEHYHDLWDIRDSCLREQSYWGFPPSRVSMNITGRLVGNIIEVFTGLQLYWIAFPNYHVKKVDYLECRHFNASRTVEKLQIKDIISKQDWQSQQPVGYLNIFQNTPINIVITGAMQPYHGCKSKAACTDILRKLQVKFFNGRGSTQKYYDIPYNFMIDDSGNIYECRGVKHECAAIYPHNGNTICLGFIGWYANKLPSEAYLGGIKKLIEYLANNQYVVSNYTVYVHQDLTDLRIPRNLEIVIKNFYRYKDFLPDDCKNISVLLVVINFSVILIIFSLTYLLYRFFNFKTACKKCKFLKDKNILIFQIFPLNLIDQDHLSNTQFDSNTPNLIYEKYVSDSNVVRSTKLIKLWFFNKTLETINSRLSINNLQNYLSHMLRKETVISIYQFDLDNSSNFVIVTNSCKINLLKQLMFSGCCICFYFNIEQIDISDFPTDIQIVK